MNDDFEDYLLPHFKSLIPAPTSRRELTVADNARFAKAGLIHLPRYLQDIGIGGYKSDRLIHCGPAAIDGLVQALQLEQYGITIPDFLAVYYTSLGLVEAVTATGDGIIVDAVAGQVNIIGGDPQNIAPIGLEFEIPSIIGGALETIEDSIASIPGGQDFHALARKEIGSLEFGECYGFEQTVRTGLQMTPRNAKVVPLVDHLAEMFHRNLFEVVKIPFDSDAVLGDEDIWGDDLDDLND